MSRVDDLDQLMASVGANIEAMGRADAEAHRAHTASCSEAFCDRCNRHRCCDCREGVAALPVVTCPDCTRLRLFERRFGSARASLPPRFTWRLTAPALRDLVGPTALAQARTALAAERVVIRGEAGAGKTSLAVAMLLELLAEAEHDDAPKPLVERARGIRFVSAYSLSKARALHRLGQGEAPLVEDALNARLLVIDDLGSERDGHSSAVTEVIYERHAECRTTWVTTWLDAAKAADRYGGGIARRIFERPAQVITLGRQGT